MSINLSISAVEMRDKRLGAITSYHGDAQTLLELSENKKVPFATRSYSQCSACSEGCAATLTYYVRGAAIVAHAPIGCDAQIAGQNYAAKAASINRHLDEIHAIKFISTNIKEKDTIYGGLDKLRNAIQEAYDRFNPEVIFVTSSCASGIVGDDIESVADEKEGELGIPIVPIFCEGFKSRVWTTGFDAAYHGILRKLVKEPKRKQENLVNIFNFQGIPSFNDLLGKLGLVPNYLVPMATVKQLEEMSEAAISVHMCETLGTYVSTALEEKYGVPEVKAPAPFGISWTDEWLRAVAAATGRSDKVEELIQSEHERIKDELEEIRKILAGKRVYVYAGDSFAHSIGNMVQDLGMTLVGMTTLHHDQRIDNQNKERLNTLKNLIDERGNISEFSVCNQQPYEVIKILRRLKPDFMIARHQGLTPLGTKLGIPTINEGDVNASLGYEGLVKLGRRIIDADSTSKFEKNIAKHAKFPYSKWWLDEEPDPFYFERKSKAE